MARSAGIIFRIIVQMPFTSLGLVRLFLIGRNKHKCVQKRQYHLRVPGVIEGGDTPRPVLMSFDGLCLPIPALFTPPPRPSCCLHWWIAFKGDERRKLPAVGVDIGQLHVPSTSMGGMLLDDELIRTLCMVFGVSPPSASVAYAWIDASFNTLQDMTILSREETLSR